MSHTERIRNSIIDKLLSINNPEILAAFNKILESNQDTIIELSLSQKKMLQMSEDDIQAGRLLSQDDINKQDAEWLN